jgi:hypothetical protein
MNNNVTAGTQEKVPMTGARIALPLWLAVAAMIAAFAVVPLGLEAHKLIAAQDDPVALADHAVARLLDSSVANREIAAALAADDVDLANSFLELARDRKVAVDPALVARVEAANSLAASAGRNVQNFAMGFVTGEPDDGVGLAGTLMGDLFVFGDIRDVVREGSRLASGQEADELILGLAGVGLAITAGTYASLGAAVPARVGVTLVKAARRTGKMSNQMAAWIGRSVREVIDGPALRQAVSNVSIFAPAASARGVRQAVKVEKAGGLMKLAGDVGTVQSKAGTKAALDGLKLADNPKDMAKVATLASAKGGKTRAILKLAGRGAIMLTMTTWNLAMWIFWAVFIALKFVVMLKRMAERSTERYCARRRARIVRAQRSAARLQAQAEIEQRATQVNAAPECPAMAPSAADAPPVSAGADIRPPAARRELTVPRRQPTPLVAFPGVLRARTA